MKISLEKGGTISLGKANEGLKQILLGAGWDLREGSGADFDLDISAALMEGGKVTNPLNFVFYNNMTSPCGAVSLSGDNRTGAGEGDDESISIDLEKLPASVDQMLFAISIHKAEQRKQNFGQVSNSYVRLLNQESGQEIMKYDLAQEFSDETLIVVGAISKKANEWQFDAKGEGYQGGLKSLLEELGLEVE